MRTCRDGIHKSRSAPFVFHRCGEIYVVDLRPVRGHEQGGTRPVLVIQNDVGNEYSSTTIVAAITSQTKKRMPIHVEIATDESGLPKDSIVLLEQIRTLDKERLKRKIGRLCAEKMCEVDRALCKSLDVE
ncbi:type II toxin-antitoxin system PemK/MazF family toxin [Candidatus Bipolaricaulota bacterium]|nr:type II toxin-antitoxin system PemK/MazF family toxin [Candidatus Bipolaricaulota bacterium]